MDSNLIYDIGMNNGDDTAYYLYKGYKVIAIEADPVLCKNATIRFGPAIRTGQLLILNLGIAPTSGTLDFWICDGNSVWSSFNKNSVVSRGMPFHAEKIPCDTIDNILKQYAIPFYMKVDIEGFDHLCIDSLQFLHSKPKFVSCEVGDIDSVINSLKSSGYHLFKLIYQGAHIPIEIPTGKEQRFYEFWNGLFMRAVRKGFRVLRVDRVAKHIRQKLMNTSKWTFPFGSSGPFGPELPGRWLTEEETIAAYRKFQLHLSDRRIQSLFRSNYYSNWIDLHACHE